ncbi:MAG TPA: NADP-dependent isocitrate dehydrogenase [Brevundimonas sp.]|jgi:isocitrate dehydrogenase|uniref:NADP-dependent isocitrate dehydrogenase n=1 Tax=Brevundimonas sp. TaxID=1871086 RepID=UPI002E0E857C|nr:NADP-dependent isocitrate dehydrogenase [Brevundimonas sp.]
MTQRVTVAFGDGIGPEIMTATLSVLDAAGADLRYDVIDIGERVYNAGHTSGIAPESWDSLRRNGVFLKAPITTPQGGGFKSLNVTIRKTVGLYANVRPCTAWAPFVRTRHPGMDVVIVRENEEDLYAGIEHRQTTEVYQCLKIVSRPGCERIVRYAFEYARANGRRKVSCFTKDNIMKLTDGLFHQVFNEIGAEYPDIEKDHWIIDIGAARLADTPEMFDVIVTPNLYGDIISDIAAQIAGSVGMGGSANIGGTIAMFEAVHGSAPDLAGKGVANPSGLLLSAVMMLNHLGRSEVAERIHNAWLATLEDGIHTPDVYDPAISREKVGTDGFAQAVIARLGRRPERLTPVSYAGAAPLRLEPAESARRPAASKTTVGVDLFVEFRDGSPDTLAARLQSVEDNRLKLKMVTNRGVKVWPDGAPETLLTDHWRCRFMNGGGPVTVQEIAALQLRAAEAGIEFIKTEHLCDFDGQPGYSLGQGQ